MHEHGVTFSGRGASGFTFIEIMIVVVIMAIASALTVPLFARTDSTKLVAAANLLAADLEFAQGDSIAHGEDPRVVVFTDSDRYWIAIESDPDTPITNPIGKIPYLIVFGQGRAQALSGVEIDSTSVGDDDMLTFKLYGQTDQTTPATITLRAGGSTLTLTVNATSGEVSIGDIDS